MNHYHRYLKLPFDIKPPKEFDGGGDTVRHMQLAAADQPGMIEPSEYMPEVNEWFESLGLKFMRVDCFYTPPQGKLGIHTDLPFFSHHAKINITWGPEEGVIRWWHSDNVRQHEITESNEHTSAYHDNLWAEEEESRLIWEANTNKPSLVNVGMLHSTYNPTNERRWTLCLTPTLRYNIPDYPLRLIPWDMATMIFNDYIVNE